MGISIDLTNTERRVSTAEFCIKNEYIWKKSCMIELKLVA